MRNLISRAARQLTRKPLGFQHCGWQGAFGRAFSGSSGYHQNSFQSPSLPEVCSQTPLKSNTHLGCSYDNNFVSQIKTKLFLVQHHKDDKDNAKDAIKAALSSIEHHCSTLRLQASAQNHSHGNAAAVLSRASAGRYESPPQFGFTAGAANLAGRALPKALHEHLHRGCSGPFSSPLPHALPRPDAQPAAKPRGKPELDLRQHGAPVRDVALPATGVNSLANVGRFWTRKRVFGGSVEASGMQAGYSSAGGLQMFGVSMSQIVHSNGTRGFRSAAGGSTLLAEESDGSEVAVDGSNSSEVAVSDGASEVAPEGKRKYGPRKSTRIPRSTVGSYDEEFEDELDLAEPSPWQDEMYNIRPRVDRFMMDELGANAPLDIEELVAEADDLGLVSEIPDAYAGLPLVLRWETRFVLAPGPSAHHPLNRKVKLQTYLRDLELSEKARERMIALVGPRFNRRSDELTLVSQRYSHREENRKDVLRILYALIEESKKADIEGEELAAVA